MLSIERLGKANNGFAFTRPPGHHACRDHSGGFCLLNNVALAAAYSLSEKVREVSFFLINALCFIVSIFLR